MLWLYLLGCTGSNDPKPLPEPTELTCSLGEAPMERSGRRRMALVVGVSDYLDESTPDLSGPAGDVRAMHQLLVEELSVPAENICVLQDATATLQDVETAFQQHLIDNARPGDAVFFYFSGHGSQQLDRDREETDGYDETLLLHDYAPGGEGGRLVDDALGELLGSLHAAMSGGISPPDIVLIFDACFSGTATRGSPGEFVVRQVPPETTGSGWVASGATGDSDMELSGGMDGVVVLAASRDDTVALEPKGGDGGLFTTSLTATLRERASGSTWRQIAHHTARLLEVELEDATLEQRPTFQGQLDRAVIGGRPGLATSWEVTELEPLTLSGVPMPGWGEGAEVRLLPAGTDPATLTSALLPETFARITSLGDFSAAAELTGDAPSQPIQIGDKAILVRAVGGDSMLPVSFDADLPEGVAESVQGLIEGFAVVSESGQMRVSPGPDGGLLIVDARDRIRSRAADSDEAARWLQLHARQHVLRQQARRLQSGELQVQAVPYPRHASCGGGDWWQPCEGSTVQVLPACDLWQLEITNQALYDTHYQVGGVLLASDGCIIGLPEDEQHTIIRAATTARLDPSWAMLAENTGSAPHELLLFGYPTDSLPVPWSTLTSDCSSGPPSLDKTRGVAELPPTWTATTLSLLVSANPHLESDACPASCGGSDVPASVDIQPFLPPSPHPLRASFLGLSEAGGSVSAALGIDDLAALPACACDDDDHDGVTLHPGDVVTLDDAAPALVVSSAVPLLWGAEGFTSLDRRQRQVTDCRRPDWPAPTDPEPMSCYCCEAP